MRFTLFLSALFVAVSATTATLIARQSLPSCAVPCLALSNTTSCSPNDDYCLCTNATFVKAATSCINSTCSGSDIQTADAWAAALCQAVGVTLTSSSAAATTTAAATATATTASSGAPITRTISVFTGAVVVLAIAAVL